MATRYVNKSGSDSNGGTSHADAWATFQKAYDTVNANDTIIVGSGVYSQTLLARATNNSNITFVADGYVLVDNSLVTSFFLAAPTNSFGVVIDGFNFKGISLIQSAFNGFFTLKNCLVENSTVTWPVGNNGVPNPAFYGEKVTFISCTVSFISSSHSGIVRKFTGCSFIGTTTFTDTTSNVSTIGYLNCYFENTPTFGTNATFDISNTNFCNFKTGQFIKGGTTYTLAQAFDTFGILENAFALPGNYNQDGTLHPLSPNIGNGKAGVDIGARGSATEYDSAGEVFDGALLTNVTRNASGYFEYSGVGTGEVLSKVLDAGSDVEITKIRARTIEGYPLDVVDFDNTDIQPNRQNFEYRFATEAAGAFGQTDPTPAWIVVERDKVFSATGRYFQVRFTFRNNGVAA